MKAGGSVRRVSCCKKKQKCLTKVANNMDVYYIIQQENERYCLLALVQQHKDVRADICDIFMYFPSCLQDDCSSSRHHIQVKVKRNREGAVESIPL